MKFSNGWDRRRNQTGSMLRPHSGLWCVAPGLQYHFAGEVSLELIYCSKLPLHLMSCLIFLSIHLHGSPVFIKSLLEKPSCFPNVHVVTYMQETWYNQLFFLFSSGVGSLTFPSASLNLTQYHRHWILAVIPWIYGMNKGFSSGLLWLYHWSMSGFSSCLKTDSSSYVASSSPLFCCYNIVILAYFVTHSYYFLS